MLRAVPEERLAPTFKELEGLKDQELRDHYDNATSADVQQPWHATFYLDELRRRGSAHSEQTMRRLTWVITILTGVNVIAVAVSVVIAASYS